MFKTIWDGIGRRNTPHVDRLRFLPYLFTREGPRWTDTNRGHMPIRLLLRFVLPCALVMAVPGAGRSEEATSAPALRRCLALSDDASRLRCLRDLTGQRPSPGLPEPHPGSSSRAVAGNWRLVRTPNPQGGKDAISVTRTAELAESDPNFAGLMIRCGDPQFEILIVLVRPLPPRTHPTVSIGRAKYDGTVIPPGAAILLPGAATVDAQASWLALPRLDIKIEEDGSQTKGVVSLDGLDAALAALSASCLARQ